MSTDGSIFFPMGCDQSLKAIIREKCRNEVGEEGMNIKDTLEENKYKS